LPGISKEMFPDIELLIDRGAHALLDKIYNSIEKAAMGSFIKSCRAPFSVNLRQTHYPKTVVATS